MLAFPPKPGVAVSPAPFLPQGGSGDAWDSPGLRGGGSSPRAHACMQWAVMARKPHTSPQDGHHHHTAVGCPTWEPLSPWLLWNSLLATQEKASHRRNPKFLMCPLGPANSWPLTKLRGDSRAEFSSAVFLQLCPDIASLPALHTQWETCAPASRWLSPSQSGLRTSWSEWASLLILPALRVVCDFRFLSADLLDKHQRG